MKIRITPKQRKIKSQIGFFPFGFRDKFGNKKIGIASKHSSYLLTPSERKEFFYKISKNNNVLLVEMPIKCDITPTFIKIDPDVELSMKYGIYLFKKKPIFMDDPICLNDIFSYRDYMIKFNNNTKHNYKINAFKNLLRAKIVEEMFYNPNITIRVTVPPTRMTNYLDSFDIIFNEKMPIIDMTYGEFFGNSRKFERYMIDGTR